MLNQKDKFNMKYLYLLSFALILILTSGCAGPKIAADLLDHAETNKEPLLKNSVTIDAEINPSINNYEGIDESVKQSLEVALRKSNIFGADSSRSYRINANVRIASQAAMSFGSFEGKLEVHYILFDENNNEIVNEIIYTEAGSDVWYFSGAKRHRRARAVNIAKNVLQFVDILQSKFK